MVQNESLFSPAESTQLQSIFSLTEENLALVLDGLCYVFEQAAFQQVGPEPLYEQILAAGVDEAHAKVGGVSKCRCDCMKVMNENGICGATHICALYLLTYDTDYWPIVGYRALRVYVQAEAADTGCLLFDRY